MAFWGTVLLFCVFNVVHAQHRFNHWTVTEGLPQNSVYAITQTLDGYLWLTTLDGLVRFDGVNFTVFNKINLKDLPSNRFVSLFAETDGTLWVATEEDGLVRFQNGQIQILTTADGLPSNRIFQVQKDLDDSLLITTENGLVSWQNGHISLKRQENARDYKIYISPSGWRWEMDAGGLKRFDKNGTKFVYPIPFDPAQIAFERTFNYFSYVSMFEDRTGTIWFAASGNLYRIENNTVTTLTKQNGMPQSLVRDITQDADGNIWIGTEKDGACYLSDNRFTCYNINKGLTSNFIRDIFSDREGTLWLTTHESGINRLTKQTITPLSTAEGLSDKNVYPILEDSKGNVWIGSTTSLSQFKDDKIKNYTQRNQLLYEFVQALLEDREGRLWIGSVGGVQYLQNGKFTDFTERLGFGIGEADFWDIHEDNDGTLWFATNRGLVKFKDGAVQKLTTQNGLPTNDVRIIYERKDGTFLLGTYSGLAIMRPDGVVLQILTEDEGLAGNYIRSIYEDNDGILWIGTYESGLSRLKDGKFTNYTTDKGLFSNGVFAILEDSRGNFWMSSNQGIYRTSRQELNDFAEGRITKITPTAFGKSDGMLNAECNGGRQPSALKRSDGKLWFPTQDGVAIIDPEDVPFNPNPPPVVIESAFLSGAKIDLKDKLEIQPSQGNLEIRYTGLSFIKPEQSRFRYKLEGLDENWIEAGTRREAYYPYLPPGKYTFHIIAANSDNVWNEDGARLEIIVHPAFYQTWWFSIFCVLAIAAIVFWLYRRRLAEAHRQKDAQQGFSRRLMDAHETERRRIAAELHDSLGQHLAMIKNSAAFGVQTAKDLDDAKVHLDKISDQTVQAITEVREISYNLRPYLLDRLGLTKAIQAMLKKIADNSELKINSEIETIDGNFADEVEISIYRIIQESINNILKHSGATKVDVLIKNDKRFVNIKITDNGKGFEVNLQNQKQSGFGLLGMRERVKMLGGIISIDAEIRKGTSILIRLESEKGKL